MLVEVVLKLLISIVDAELLKAVGGKVLKAKYIQHTDGQTLEQTEAYIMFTGQHACVCSHVCVSALESMFMSVCECVCVYVHECV